MTDETNPPAEQAPADPNPQAAGATSETAATDSTSGTTASSTGTPSVTSLDPVDPNVAGVGDGSTAPLTPATDAPGATLTTGEADAGNVQGSTDSSSSQATGSTTGLVDPNESALVTTQADMSAHLATKSKHGTAVDLEMHLKAEIAKLIGWPAHLEHAAKAFFDGLHSHIDNEAAK